MGDMPFSMESEKPVVWIHALQPIPEDAIGHILLGLEEEGIPAKVKVSPSGSAEIIAKQAADGSRLNVGIGVDGKEQVVVLHHRDLPSEKPLFSLSAEEFQETQMWRLGLNTARLVKGNPLIFQDNPEYRVEPERKDQLQNYQSEDSIQLPQDQLEELISGVVTEILNNIK